MAWSRSSSLGALAVGLLGCSLYGLTKAPSFTWQHDAADSAELAAAAYAFAVPHPTGYPLWLLLAAPVAHLPSGGDVAGRLGWLSAVCAALAAGVLTIIAAQLVQGNGLARHPGEPALSGARRNIWSEPALLAGMTAGLALLASTGVWNVAVVTETYTLHLLLVAAIFGAAMLGLRQRWRALLGGLALANHVTALPMVVAALLFGRGQARLRLTDLLWLLPGLSLYLLLPWRAHSQPAGSWGDPETLTAFWALVSGSAYHYLLVWPAPGEILTRFLATAHSLVTQFPLPFWPLALIGLPALARLGHLWLVTGALYLLLPIFYRAAGVEHYLLPDVALLALAAGLGMADVGTRPARRLREEPNSGGAAPPSRRSRISVRMSALFPWFLLLLLTLPSLVIGAGSSSLRGEYGAREWALHLLDAAPPGETVLTADDGQTFALWYLQRVDHVRTDVTVIDVRLWRQPWYRRAVAAGTANGHAQ